MRVRYLAVETPSDCSIFVTMPVSGSKNCLSRLFQPPSDSIVNRPVGVGNFAAAGTPGDHRPVALCGPDRLAGGREQVVHELLRLAAFEPSTTAIGFWIRIVSFGITYSIAAPFFWSAIASFS